MTRETDRHIKITWADIDEALTKQGTIMASEEIKAITLIKPRQLLIQLQLKAKEA